MAHPIKTTFFLLMIIIFTSCMSMYIPDKHNIPNLEQAGEVDAALAISPIGLIDAAVFVSPIKSVFIGGKLTKLIGQESIWEGHRSPNDDDSYRFMEGCIGLNALNNFNKVKIMYELSYSFGNGKFEIRDPGFGFIFPASSSSLKGNYHRHALLAALTIDYLPVSLSLSARIAKLNYYNTEGNLRDIINGYYTSYIDSHSRHLYIEPALTLGFKYNNVRIYGQLIIPFSKYGGENKGSEYFYLYSRLNLHGCFAYHF